MYQVFIVTRVTYGQGSMHTTVVQFNSREEALTAVEIINEDGMPWCDVKAIALFK